MMFIMPLGWCIKKILTKLLQGRTSYFSTENNKHGLFKTRNKYKLLLSTLCCFMLSQVLVLNRGSGRRISLFRVIKQVENQMKPNKCVFCTSLTMLYFCTENERNVFHRKSTGRFLHGMPLKTPVTVSERT